MTEQTKPRSAIYDELTQNFQKLLNLVAQYRSQMSQAKTLTKVKFYQKKIDKVRPQIVQIAEYITILDNKYKTED